MLYKVVKLWAEFLPAEFGTFWVVAQQPNRLWQNGDHSWIQFVKEV